MNELETNNSLYPLCDAIGLDGNKFTESHIDQLVASWGVITTSKAMRVKQVRFKIMLAKGEPIPYNEAPQCLLMDDLPDERWKVITPEDTEYMISDYGRVKSFKYISTKICKPFIVTPEFRGGYYSVDLRPQYVKHNHFRTHRLVAEAFVPKTEMDVILNRDNVNHIDGDKLNPYYANLEWVSCRENTLHGLRRSVSNNHNLSEEQLTNIYKLHMAGFTDDEISKMPDFKNIVDTSIVNKIISYYDYKAV